MDRPVKNATKTSAKKRQRSRVRIGKVARTSIRDAAKHIGNTVYIAPFDTGWGIKKEGKVGFERKFSTEIEALEAVHNIKGHGRVVMYKKDGSLVDI